MEIHGCAADEGGCEAPGHAYEEEAEDIVEDGGGCGWGGGRGVHGVVVGGVGGWEGW